MTRADAFFRRAGMVVGMALTVAGLMRLFADSAPGPAAKEDAAVSAMAAAWNGAINFGAPYAALDPSRAGEDAAPAAGFNPADDYWGLPRTPGYEEVAGWCGACHSLALAMQQRQNRAGWTAVIDRMIARQGMPDPGPSSRATITAYLTREFGRE